MSELNLEAMALARGVVETIVAIAVQDVEGVASVAGTASPAGILAAFASRPVTQGIDVQVSEDNTVAVTVHIEVVGGTVLPEVAANVRTAVADAVLAQVGVSVSRVDVFIDSVQFAA